MAQQDKQEYLQKLKNKQEQLKVRIQAVEAREKTKIRKQDTHRKILVGAYFLDKAIKENTMGALRKELDTFLTRDSDRVLFDLPLKENKAEKTEVVNVHTLVVSVAFGLESLAR